MWLMQVWQDAVTPIWEQGYGLLGAPLETGVFNGSFDLRKYGVC